MSDWIDDWKKQRDAQREEERAKEQLRLHKAAMIRAKLPGFWELLVRCVGEDAEQLRQAFPSDEAFHCEIARDARPVADRPLIIQRAKHPYRRIEIRLNLDGQLLEIRMGTVFDTMGNVENPEREDVESASPGTRV